MKKIHRTPLSICPICSHKLDACQGVDHDEAPKAGDFVGCAKCGQILVLNSERRPRLPTPEDRKVIRANPELMKSVARLMASISGFPVPPDAPRCYVCKTPHDLRPYGMDGKPICCDCATSTPERAAEATRRLNEAFDRNAVGGIAVLDPERGFISMDEVPEGKALKLIDIATGQVIRPEKV